ncbi:MAG: alpha/beta hydrolase [Pseudomonadota bacterium]
MFGGHHRAPALRIDVPVLAVTGECDQENMRAASIRQLFGPLCAQLEVVALAECGHYPMQEAPPLLTSVVQRFLAG